MAVKITKKASTIEGMLVRAWKTKSPVDLVGYLRGVLLVEKRYGTKASIRDIMFLYEIAWIKSPLYTGEQYD